MNEYKALGKSWEDFSQLSIETKRDIAKTHYLNNKSWILAQINELNTGWILVGGDSGKIYTHGSTDDFLDKEVREEIQNETNEVLFKWVRPPQIDYEG